MWGGGGGGGGVIHVVPRWKGVFISVHVSEIEHEESRCSV